MECRTVPFTALEITSADVADAIGYGPHVPDENVLQLISGLLCAFENIQTHYCLDIFDGMVHSKRIEINGVPFNSGTAVANVMQGAKQFAVFVATAGEEYERLCAELTSNKDADILSQYIADAIGSTIAVKLGSYVEKRLADAIIPQRFSHHLSPGYCHWPVSDQRPLFDLLGGNPCGVRLSDGFLMYPVKSLSGIIAIGDQLRQEVSGCDICPMVRCFRRHASTKLPNKT